jgi:hypothetical protein
MTQNHEKISGNSPSTIQSHRLLPRQITLSHWQQRLSLTHHPRTSSKIALLVLIHHLRQSTRSNNVASVNESVEVTSGFLDALAHVIFAVEVEDVGDQVEGVLIVVHFSVEAGEVEAVG